MNQPPKDTTQAIKARGQMETIVEVGTPPHEYQSETKRGFVPTDQTIVGICASYYWQIDYSHKWTELHIVHNGRHHKRDYSDYYSDRYIVTLARRFAAEIVTIDAKEK